MLKKSKTILLGFNPCKSFYIYSLEWKENELIWKINGLTVKIEKMGIPAEPMFINISSGIPKKINEEKLPGTLEVDWVKCYQEKTN